MKRRVVGSKGIRRYRGAAAAAGVVSMILTGCAPVSEGANLDVSTFAFAHVHGLGVDAASGVAFAATHDGVFILPSLGSPTVDVAQLGGPVSGRVQDFMGFTVHGSQIFASGHPGPEDLATGAPQNLGFITSLDKAATWETLSLGGEADFHDLAAMTDPGGNIRIYGYHAGTVLFSPDGGISWVSGAKLALRDLAADPSRPGTVYATTADGLAVSNDDGGSFSLIPDAPALYLIDAWQDADGVGLVGIGTDGQVWAKIANGEWRATTGRVTGDVEAMVYGSLPKPALLVADRRGIVVSDDFGVSWRILVSK